MFGRHECGCGTAGKTGVSGQSCPVVVARAFSLIVRVLLRKSRRLYIDDGI